MRLSGCGRFEGDDDSRRRTARLRSASESESITLADKNRAHHEAARRYWRHFLDNEIPIFLSTIVASEFSIKQEIPPEILRSCVVLPFNWDDALRAAKLDWKRLVRLGWSAMR
jgi:hypothetical protein